MFDRFSNSSETATSRTPFADPTVIVEFLTTLAMPSGAAFTAASIAKSTFRQLSEPRPMSLSTSNRNPSQKCHSPTGANT